MILTLRQKLENNRDVTPMVLVRVLSKCFWVVRDMLPTRYHPERHYMRGPGPACARKQRLEGLKAENSRVKLAARQPQTAPRFAPRA